MRIAATLGLACGFALAIPLFCEARPSLSLTIGIETRRNSVLQAADTQHGELIFRSRCSTCHSVVANSPAPMGPDLHGLFGRRAGNLPDYDYSAALRAANIVWNAQTLDAYLKDPHKKVPGVNMPFPGIPNKADRDHVISYLEEATQ